MTQSTSEKILTKNTSQQAISVIQNIALNGLLFAALGIYLAIQTGGAWQAYQFIILSTQVVLINFACVALIRNGRLLLGVWTFFISDLIAPVWASLLVFQLGYVALAYILVTTYFMIRYAIPKESQRAAWVLTAFGLVISFVAELVNPAWRLTSSLMLVVSPILTGLLGLVFFVTIARQAWAGNLRNKLLVAFISVAIVATGALGVFVAITTTNNLRRNLERELTAVVVNRAARLGDLLSGQIDNLITISLDDVLQRAAIVQNQSYIGNAAAIQAEINEKDAQWRAADDANNNADPLVRERLTNPAALDLIEYQSAFPDNAEVFITDIYGGLVASSNRTSDYNQADEEWWQNAYNNGQGATYISTPQLDESTGKIGIQIALPLLDRDTGKIIGILRTTYILTPLGNVLQQEIGQTGVADIFIPEFTNSHIHEGVLEPIDSQVVEQLEEAANQGMVEMDYEGNLSVVTQAPIQSLAGHPAVDRLGWKVVFHQDRIEAFAPVNAQIQGIIIVIILVIILVVFAAIFIAQLLTEPLTQLTKTAQEIAAGNLDSQAKVTSSDEIGLLGSAFNTMTARLREFIDSLEQRVAERTHSLELAAEVGRTVSQVRALDVMLKDAAEIIRSRFDLYYTQVYLTNPNQTELLLQAGTGVVGAELVGRGHHLPLNTGSINGRAAVEKRSVVISDTAASATFRPNPLLPDTRSEMAIPLIVGENVVGVLDLQSHQADVLNQDMLPAFEALAGQLAIAIQNANLLAETNQARAEVEAQARRLARAGWQDYMNAIHQPEFTGFVFEKNDITPLSEPQLVGEGAALTASIAVGGEPLGELVVEMEKQNQNTQNVELVNIVARQVAQQIENLRLLDSAERYRFEAEQASRRMTREGWQEFLNGQVVENLSYLYDLKEVKPYTQEVAQKPEESAFTLPLKVRDETIGKLSVLGLESTDNDAVTLANAVADRLGAHIEGLRQFDQTQSALAQSETLFEASRRLTQAADLPELVSAAVSTLNIPGINRAVLATFNYDPAGSLESLDIIANWWNGTGHEATPVGTRYPLDVIRVMPMFVSPTPVFFDDMFNDERVDATTLQLVKSQNLRAVAVLPLHLGSSQVGALIMEAEEVHHFSQGETRLFSALAPQIATVLENRRQFARAQKQAEREGMLNVISQKIQSATTVEAVLQIAARELGHALGAPMTIAQLSMKDKQ